MQVQLPRLTDGRRAGLLAAVAVYPLTRIAGTIPRPALDRAIVSGAGMALAYAAATSTTNVVRDLVAAPDEQTRDRRTAAVTGVLAVTAAGHRGGRGRANPPWLPSPGRSR